jgi:hypothetical protein
VGHELHPVTDPQDRELEAEKLWIADGCPRIVDTEGSPGEYQTLGREGQNGLRRGMVGQDLAIHLGFPHRAGDELGILRSEIEDQYLFGMDNCHDDASGQKGKIPGVPTRGEISKSAN